MAPAGDTPLAFTLAELATLLDPPMSRDELGHLVKAARIQPVGTGRPPSPQGGRPPDAYDAALLAALHAAVVPFQGRTTL